MRAGRGFRGPLMQPPHFTVEDSEIQNVEDLPEGTQRAETEPLFALRHSGWYLFLCAREIQECAQLEQFIVLPGPSAPRKRQILSSCASWINAPGCAMC